MTKRHWVVVGVGLAVVAIGVVLGLSPVSLPNQIPCGAAWSTSWVPYFAEECSAAREGKGTVAVVVVAVGVLIAAAGTLSAYLAPSKTAA